VVSIDFASTTRIAAPLSTVWDVMTDHVRWARWGSASRVTIERAGVPAPNGLGAVRCFRSGPIKVFEEVTMWEPPVRMGYRLNTTTLVKEYSSIMALRDDNGATVLDWSSHLQPRFVGTGWLLRRVFGRSVAGFARGIAGEPEAAPRP
jgi:uncharacterized protein YndB with AHSA1/START domain